jgi:transposase
MSLKPQIPEEIPAQTVEVARAAFPKGNIYMNLRDEFEAIYQDEQFQKLYPQRGQPSEAPWRLALVTLMQFMENLTDRQTADAVRGRIDWKYALGLELTDPGFHYSILCEFRTRLILGGSEQLLFDTVLEVCRKRGWIKQRGKQRTDSTYIVAAVRRMNRVELVGEALFHVLDVLARVDPAWLKNQAKPEWFERYSQRLSSFRLPKAEKEQLELAKTIGQDGISLLTAIYHPLAPAYLCKLPAIEALRRIWLQNYYQEGDELLWRSEKECPPCHLRITSPYDEDARLSNKRDVYWNGYKVHLTETCEKDSPNLITHVETTPATTQDNMVVDHIHEALQNKEILPKQHFVDAGYPSAELLVSSDQNYGVDLFGPVRPDVRWQVNDEQAFDITQFQVDWESHKVTCPMGNTNTTWYPDSKGPRGKPTIQVHFGKRDCRECEVRARCTRSKSAGRGITLQPKEQHLALQAARERQKTEEFREAYSIRSGIEGTIDQAVDKLEMRRSRYRGLAKTHFHHLITAGAVNIKRMLDWLAEKPRSVTYKSNFAALVPA